MDVQRHLTLKCVQDRQGVASGGEYYLNLQESGQISIFIKHLAIDLEELICLKAKNK